MITKPYSGGLLLCKAPDFPEGPQYSAAVDTEEFVSDIGARVVRTMGGRVNEERQHTFSFQTRADLEEFRAFLKATTYGKWGGFWMPSWADDFLVLGGDMFTVVVRYAGYAANLLPTPTYRQIIAMRYGNPFDSWGRWIGGDTGFVDNGDGTESIIATLDFPYNLSYASLPTDQGHRTMYVHWCRCSSDDVEIRMFGREDSELTISVMTMPEEA